MKTSSLSPRLLKKIRSNCDVSKLVNIFNLLYWNYRGPHLAHYFRLFLCAAIEFDHNDLVGRLVKDERCEIDYSSPVFDRLIFLVIITGNAEILEIILRVGSSATARSVNVLRGPRGEKWTDLSPLEYAYLLYRPECIKLVISYARKQQREISLNVRQSLGSSDSLSITPFASTALSVTPPTTDLPSATLLVTPTPELTSATLVVTPMTEPHSATILHSVITLTKDCFYRDETLRLSDIVTVLLSCGASVNDRDQQGVTPLHFLFQMVQGLISDNMDDTMDMTSERRKIILDTARVLLDAGADTSGKHGLTPLELLMSNISHRNIYNLCTSHESQFLTLMQLFELVAMRTTFAPRRWERLMADVWLDGWEVADCHPKFSGTMVLHNALMNGLANALRCLSLRSGGVTITDAWGTTKATYGYNYVYLVDSFVSITSYSSSRPGRSNRFIGVALNLLTDAEYHKLKTIFVARLMDEHLTAESRASHEVALSWIMRLTHPCTLMHLCRKTVRDVISGVRVRDVETVPVVRGVKEEDVETLPLPKCLRDYVLMIDYSLG